MSNHRVNIKATGLTFVGTRELSDRVYDLYTKGNHTGSETYQERVKAIGVRGPDDVHISVEGEYPDLTYIISSVSSSSQIERFKDKQIVLAVSKYNHAGELIEEIPLTPLDKTHPEK